MCWNSENDETAYLLPTSPYYDYRIDRLYDDLETPYNIPGALFTNPSDSLPYYDTNGNTVTNANRSRTDLMKVSQGDVIVINGISNSNTINLLSAFSLERNIVLASCLAGDGYGVATYKEYIVPEGVDYIQICSIFQPLDNSVYLKNKANVAIATRNEVQMIGKRNKDKVFTIEDLSLAGTASRVGTVISLSGGDSNYASLEPSPSIYHWQAGIRFVSTNDCDLKFGKGNNYVHIVKGVSSTTISVYYNAELVNTVTSSVNVENEKTYGVKLDFNVLSDGNGSLKCQLISELGELFEYTFNIFSTNGNMIISASSNVSVSAFYLNIENFYDTKNLKLAILGDSYVQGHSLGAARIYTYANLLAKTIGEDRCVNFGLGGSNMSATIARAENDLQLARCANYVMVPMSCNEGSNDFNSLVAKIVQIAHEIVSIGSIPIFGTFIELPTGYSLSVMPQVNNWIKNSGYLYIDFDSVLRDSNGDVDSSLFLADNTHPTVEGHQRLYNRILIDCPFLF